VSVGPIGSVAAAPTGSPRDQSESAFASILGTLVRRTPGARAAALVDLQGETVDYAGIADPFALRVAAAHWRIVFAEARAQPTFARTEWISLRSASASFVVRGLPEEYAVLVVFDRGAGVPAILRRSFDHFAAELGREAGWPAPAATWLAVDVLTEGNRPTAIRRGEDIDPLDVLGLFSEGLGRHEQGWRVRMASGVEATLVREACGLWYTDELAATTPCDLKPLRLPAQKKKKSV
jgi:hypothetical protein